MLIKWILGEEEKIHSSSVIWNAVGGALNAGQSAIILIFISHRLGIVTAGMVTIAFAVAQLFLAIAKYGVRNYQVTDIHEKFSFGEYLYARIIVLVITGIILLLYLLYEFQINEDYLEKGMIILAVVILKLIDAVEDVFLGRYQQVGRLDIGAKIMAFRIAANTAVIAVVVCVGGGILPALWLGIISSVCIDIYCIARTKNALKSNKQPIIYKNVFDLLKVCFPLCVGMTLSIYIGNVPKYMINSYMDEETQAIFGYIMMPVFVITLLNQFIYQPIVKELGELWEQKKVKVFRGKVIRQCLIVGGLTLVILAIGLTIGLPILSLMYNTDLTIYRSEFTVLLLGGGIYALAYYLNVPITTIRRQKYIAVGYAVAAVLAVVFGRFFVMWGGMMGAAVLYLCITILLAVIYSIVLGVGIHKEAK